LIPIVYGYNFDRTFGAFEENIKQHLKNDASEVLVSSYYEDGARINVVIDNSLGLPQQGIFNRIWTLNNLCSTYYTSLVIIIQEQN
jgi:hypothetical protein